MARFLSHFGGGGLNVGLNLMVGFFWYGGDEGLEVVVT